MRGEPKLIKLIDKAGNLKSPYWYIQYYNGSRSSRISTGYRVGSQDHEAYQALANFCLERTKPVSREASELMIVQALKDYYDEHAAHKPSAATVGYLLKPLTPFWMSYPVSAATSAKANEYIAMRKRAGVKQATIRRELSVLKSAINHEIKEGRIVSAPVFKLPSESPARTRWLTMEESQRLLAECTTPHIKAFTMIMLLTGRRPGEVENLTWFQVDFIAKLIYFDQDGKEASNKRKVPVPMNDDLYTLLADLHAVKTCEHVLEWKGIKAGSVRKAFERALQRAGIKGASRYTLRHTVGTWLAQGGLPLWKIAGLMGHTDTRTTDRNYAKHHPEYLRDVTDALQQTAQKVRNIGDSKNADKRKGAENMVEHRRVELLTSSMPLRGIIKKTSKRARQKCKK